MKLIPEDKLFQDVDHSAEVHKSARDSVLKILRDNNFKVGVEIGIQYGQLSERLLDNGVVETLYGIDPYDTNIGTITPLNDKSRDNEVYGFVLGKLNRFKDRYTHIKKTSNEALFDVNEQIDCIYIDGGKSKQQIYDDISFWFPKIRKNGIICGHDYAHSSYPYISSIVDSYFGFAPQVKEGGIWWVKKEGQYKIDRKVSVVTPFYNASRYMVDFISSIIFDPRIKEVIIVDDFSRDEEYIKMRNFAKPMNATTEYDKVQVYRNEENLGEFATRIQGAELATSDWVVFLDNDNYLTPKYLDAIYAIPNWREDVIYAPDFGNHEHINYRELDGLYISKENAKKFLNKPYMFTMFLNTGNYFMNRKNYLEISKPISKIPKHAYGDIYFNGAWLDNNNLMFVVPEMEYVHTIRKDSAWKEHKDEMQPIIDGVINRLKNA